jgi:hypothetical protein
MGSVRVDAQRPDQASLARRQQLREDSEVIAAGCADLQRSVHVDPDHVPARGDPQLSLAGKQYLPGLVLLAAD